MKDFLQYLFSDYAQDFGFIACLIFLFRWNRLKQIETWIALLVMACNFFDAFSAALSFHSKISTQWFYNFSTFIEATMFTYIYYRLLDGGKLKKVIIFIYSIYAVLSVINFKFIQRYEVFNSYTYVPMMAFIALLSFLYLRQSTAHLEEKPFNNFFFWFSVATLIDYTCGTPMMATLSWYAFENPELELKLWSFVTLFYSLWFGIITIGLIWTKRRTLPSL